MPGCNLYLSGNPTGRPDSEPATLSVHDSRDRQGTDGPNHSGDHEVPRSHRSENGPDACNVVKVPTPGVNPRARLAALNARITVEDGKRPSICHALVEHGGVVTLDLSITHFKKPDFRHPLRRIR